MPTAEYLEKRLDAILAREVERGSYIYRMFSDACGADPAKIREMYHELLAMTIDAKLKKMAEEN